jgi:L-cysteine/cystine lyase
MANPLCHTERLWNSLRSFAKLGSGRDGRRAALLLQDGKNAQMTPDDEKVTAIRNELPAVHDCAYLNTGSNGPLPRSSYQALEDQARRELDEGRTKAKQVTQVVEMQEAARQAFADVLGCDSDEVALTHSATEGINIALMGLDWQRGDEVITSTTEHSGGLFPLLLLKQRYDVGLRMTRIGALEMVPVAELQKALRSGGRTRAVMLSHVSWSTGRVLPIAELARMAHEAGVPLICDAAQSCGMVPSHVDGLGVDVYACAGQKWLCGPQGTGAVFVRRERMGEIQQTYIGSTGIETIAFAEARMAEMEGHFVPSAGAKRYEALTLHPPSIKRHDNEPAVAHKASGMGLDLSAYRSAWEVLLPGVAEGTRRDVTHVMGDDGRAGAFSARRCSASRSDAATGEAGRSDQGCW